LRLAAPSSLKEAKTSAFPGGGVTTSTSLPPKTLAYHIQLHAQMMGKQVSKSSAKAGFFSLFLRTFGRPSKTVQTVSFVGEKARQSFASKRLLSWSKMLGLRSVWLGSLPAFLSCI
jgi:hypothetical protein